MNPDDLFEQKLRELKPAAAPDDFVQRVVDAGPRERFAIVKHDGPLSERWAGALFRWVMWGAATAAVVLLAAAHFTGRNASEKPRVAMGTASKVDPVEVNKQILGKFDGGIVELPNRNLVRLTCYVVRDEVRIKDGTRGVLVRQGEPRVEIRPANLAVY